MGISPFFIGQHRVHKPLGILQILFAAAESVGQGQVSNCNAHICCALLRMFQRQLHLLVSVGLFQQTLVLHSTTGIQLQAIGFQITDKYQSIHLLFTYIP